MCGNAAAASALLSRLMAWGTAPLELPEQQQRGEQQRQQEEAQQVQPQETATAVLPQADAGVTLRLGEGGGNQEVSTQAAAAAAATEQKLAGAALAVADGAGSSAGTAQLGVRTDATAVALTSSECTALQQADHLGVDARSREVADGAAVNRDQPAVEHAGGTAFRQGSRHRRGKAGYEQQRPEDDRDSIEDEEEGSGDEQRRRGGVLLASPSVSDDEDEGGVGVGKQTKGKKRRE